MNLHYNLHTSCVAGKISFLRLCVGQSVSGNLVLFVFALANFFFSAGLSASTLPSGFAETRLATGLDPTGIEFAPDGRLFITEKNGKVRIIKNGTLLSTPFLTLTVDNSNERGLQSITFDPNFSTNNYMYVYYTVPQNGSVATHNRVSRFTANGDVAVAGSETILLELDNLSAGNHNGGALFFKDGKLFITTGENAVPNNSQVLTNLLGKILRINPDGTIPTDNPFYTTATGKNRAIWAIGFRNPFKAVVQPGTGRIFINDVGGGSFEEVNDGMAGKNYGWPGIEGFRNTQTPPANYQDPVYAYGRSSGCSITGGTFYNPATAQFPGSYVGKYFFADYCNGYIKTLDAANGSAVAGFATGINRPIDIKVASDGSLYYLARGGLGGGSVEDNTSSSNGEVWRVYYSGSQAPTISAQPVSQSISVGGSVTFIVGASGSAPLSYQWQRNGVNISGATSSSYTLSPVTIADNGATFRAIVTNAAGSVTSNNATLTVTSNQQPTASITSPVTGALYTAGGVINYAGTGTDPEDGTLPASAFTWKIDFHHDTHTHPALSATSGVTSGTFTVPTTGETSDNVWYRIYLTVTDAQGQTQTTYKDIYPSKATLTLVTNPSGLQVNLDGQTVTTPYTFVSVVGVIRTIEAISPQQNYQFSAWSDAGAIAHNISTPAANTTYTATFTQGLRQPENPADVVNGLDYSYYEGSWSNLPDFNTLTAVESGTVNNFDLATRNQNDNFGFRFTGYIQVPTDGNYTFYTSSDDGSRLYIGNSLVVDNDGLHSNEERSGTIGLKAGKHAISVVFFELGGDEILTVSYAGPGISKQPVPVSALFRTGSVQSFILEAENAARVGVQSSTLHSGYTGTGFGDYVNANNDYIEWTANVASAGSYTLQFRYGLGSGGNRPLQIKVNGTTIQSSLAFPNTTTWTNWSIVSINANLNAGSNLIRATAIGSSGPNVDHLKVSLATGGRLAGNTDGESETSTIVCYPIPASGSLTIESIHSLEGNIYLTAAQGTNLKPVYKEKQDKLIVLDVAGLKNGLYFLTIQTKDKTVTKKISIQR